MFSDGGKNVLEIFDTAKQNDVKVISITDHNNIDAYDSLPKTNLFDIKIIQGVEVDAVFDEIKTHIVMYGFEKTKAVMRYFAKAKRYDIKDFKRMVKSTERLNGIKIDRKILKNFIRKNQYFDKVRLNNLLVEAKFANTAVDAFYNFSKDVKDKTRYSVPAKKLFKIAKQSGGLTFVAHPMKYLKQLETVEKLEEYILKLKKIGLDGVEVFNNRQNQEEETRLLNFTKNNDLLISAGSDYHAKIGAKESKQIGEVLEKEINSNLVSQKIINLIK